MPSKKMPIEFEHEGILVQGKHCCCCGKLKVFIDFPRSNQKSDGYQSYCKECKSVKDKANYEKNKEKIKSRTRHYYHEQMKDNDFVLKERQRSRKKHKIHGHKYREYYRHRYHNDAHFLAQKKKKDAEWRAENKLKVRLKTSRRRYYLKNLPNNFTESDWLDMMYRFNHKCALTRSDKDISIEHFIPLSTGHGGHIKGNIYPASLQVNLSKQTRNPFEWYSERSKELGISENSWVYLIELLASQNNLSVEEFEDYVNWCFKNKRKTNEISSSITSLDLWRESNVKN